MQKQSVNAVRACPDETFQGLLPGTQHTMQSTSSNDDYSTYTVFVKSGIIFIRLTN